MWMEILCPLLQGIIAVLQKDEVVKVQRTGCRNTVGLQKIRAVTGAGERRGRDRSRAGQSCTDSR